MSFEIAIIPVSLGIFIVHFKYRMDRVERAILATQEKILCDSLEKKSNISKKIYYCCCDQHCIAYHL